MTGLGGCPVMPMLMWRKLDGERCISPVPDSPCHEAHSSHHGRYTELFPSALYVERETAVLRDSRQEEAWSCTCPSIGTSGVPMGWDGWRLEALHTATMICRAASKVTRRWSLSQQQEHFYRKIIAFGLASSLRDRPATHDWQSWWTVSFNIISV